MIQAILEMLATFRLFHEDDKHQKRVSKKEKEDGIKRPIQKFFMQPSLLLGIAILVISTISAILFFSYQRSSIFPKKTKIELKEMTEWIEKWHEKNGHYPTDLNQVIGNSPMKKGWEKDSWNRPYKYSKTDNGQGFVIISAGSDGQFDTDDDIKLK